MDACMGQPAQLDHLKVDLLAQKGNLLANAPVGNIAQAVNQLEALLLRAEADLSYVHRKLDTELGGKFDVAGSEQLNPLRILARIRDVKVDIGSVTLRNKQLWADKQGVSKQLKELVQDTRADVSDLQSRCGIEATPVSHDEELLLEMTEKPDAAAADSNSGGQASQPGSSSKGTDATPAPPEREYCEYTAITEEEFMGVSEFVRGRCKLNDVNDVYKQLCCHFKELKSSKKRRVTPLGPRDMSTMGLKVSGATGQAKLKVLRALKIIDINKKDKAVSLIV